MVKIKGWTKLVDTPNRVYWEHNKKYLHNVEKVGNTWTHTYGVLKGPQYTNIHTTKQKAMNTAIKDMRLLYDDTPIKNIKTRDELRQEYKNRKV